MERYDFLRRFGLATLLPLVVAAGCASLTVHKVERTNKPNVDSVQGVRYFLPKPFLLVAPQADGTVSVNVIYLPDRSKEYAISTSSTWSSYSFQATTDASGVLTGVQYGADTTAMGTQLSSSVASGLSQTLNLQAAQAAAVQTQVNTAQGALVTAKSTLAAAQAALDSDTASNVAKPGTVTSAAIQVDQSAVAQAQAKLQVAQSALQQTQGTTQAVPGAAAVTAPIAQAGAPANSGTLTAPSWTVTAPISLPEKYGPVLYAISESKDQVSLKAVSGKMFPDAQTEQVSDLYGTEYSQQAFDTSTLALLPGVLTGPTAPISRASQSPALFTYDRQAKSADVKVYKADNAQTVESPAITVDLLNNTITVNTSTLLEGTHLIEVKFTYLVGLDSDGKDQIMRSTVSANFTLKK